ncbi:hypothetical protein BH24ACT9_BH24ACT9_11450 [soil metagenome]
MANTAAVRDEIRRDEDHELLGFVQRSPGTAGVEWLALSVFGGLLAAFDTESAAHEHVRSTGLSTLAESWWVRPVPAGQWYEATLVEVRPDEVRCRYTEADFTLRTLAIPQPGPETLRLTRPA